MGYTHYFKLLAVPSKAAIESVLKQSAQIRSKFPQIIIQKQYDDPSPPIFTQQRIQFNGVGESDGHQTFSIQFTESFKDFCKTARKPYDTIVCLILLSLSNHCNEFKFSSDGNLEEWGPLITFYSQQINKQTTMTQKWKEWVS